MRQRGSVLVELAFVVPLLTLLAFATFDYGRNLNIQQTMERVLFEGLRQASKDESISNTPLNNNANTWNPASFSNFYTGSGPNTLNSQGVCARGNEMVCRILELTFRNFRESVRVTKITIDYDITRNEDSESDNFGTGAGNTQRCSRTIRGELEYQLMQVSFFKALLAGKAKARVPYFKIGLNEEGNRCVT